MTTFAPFLADDTKQLKRDELEAAERQAVIETPSVLVAQPYTGAYESRNFARGFVMASISRIVKIAPLLMTLIVAGFLTVNDFAQVMAFVAVGMFAIMYGLSLTLDAMILALNWQVNE